jgi:hypothetical protein
MQLAAHFYLPVGRRAALLDFCGGRFPSPDARGQRTGPLLPRGRRRRSQGEQQGDLLVLLVRDLRARPVHRAARDTCRSLKKFSDRNALRTLARTRTPTHAHASPDT